MGAVAIKKIQTLFEIPDLPADLIQEALTVAGASHRYPDGFKSLSQLGATCINVCVQEMGYRTSMTRELISDFMTKYNTMEYRAVVARRNGIQDLIVYGKNGTETEKVLAFAISALIATVYLTQDRDFVRRCVIKLGFLDEGSGLQMRQKYEAVMLGQSASLLVNLPSITPASIQNNITTDGRSSSLPDQQMNEASCSEGSNLTTARPEMSLTSEGISFVPFNISNETHSDIIDCSARNCENNQNSIQAIHDTQYMGLFDSPFRQDFGDLQCVHPLASPSQHRAFSLQTRALGEPVSSHDSVYVEADATIALADEPMSMAVSTSTTRKRKALSDKNAQKAKRVNTEVKAKWVNPLMKEMERCQLESSCIPPSVFFREEIKVKCLNLDSRWSELLTSVLVQIADSSSFACLRDAVCASKSMEPNRARKISIHTSMGDRLRILEELNGENIYNAFLARYHILELFRECGGHEGTENLRIIPYAAENTVAQPSRRGNPTRIALAEVTHKMMGKAFPSLTPDTEEYRLRATAMKRHRSLASRFQILVDKFGPAILCFIQPLHGQYGLNGGISDNKIREINEISLRAFVEILDQSQGDYLRAVCRAADPLLQYLVYDGSTITEFGIERTDVDILQFPKGSEELLRLLEKTSRTGGIAEIH